MNNLKTRYVILRILGILPFLGVLFYGIFSMTFGFAFLFDTTYGITAFFDSILVISLLIWPLYIIGILLVIYTTKKIKDLKD